MPTKTAIDFVQETVAHPPTGSPLGHHFIQAYNENKWNWFLRYVRCLVPDHTPTPLIYGGAIHSALEYVYKQWDVEGMVYVFREVLSAREKEYADPDRFRTDLGRGPQELLFWANEWLEHDKQYWKVLAVEEDMQVPLPADLTMTMRLDLIVQDKENGDILVRDHKTTGWSVGGTVNSMDQQDQVTAYLYGLSQVHPDWYRLCQGLQPDILYHKGNVMKAARPTILTRTKHDLQRYAVELSGLLTEMSQKVLAYIQGSHSPYALFPRNGKDSAMFGRVDYEDLQRAVLPANPLEAPPGYVVDEETLNNVLQPFLRKAEQLAEAGSA